MYSRLCSASFQSFPPAFRFGPDQFLTRVVPLITNEHRCNKPSEIRHERGGGGGEPGAESPHDAQRTNGAADSGHMSINPLRPLNASLPFHYSTPFRRPRSPPPPTLSLPICIVAHLDAGHSSRGPGGAELRRLVHPTPLPPPPRLLSAFFFSRFPLAAGLMNSSAPAGPGLQLFTRRTPSKCGSVIRRGLTPENPAKSRLFTPGQVHQEAESCSR